MTAPTSSTADRIAQAQALFDLQTRHRGPLEHAAAVGDVITVLAAIEPADAVLGAVARALVDAADAAWTATRTAVAGAR